MLILQYHEPTGQGFLCSLEGTARILKVNQLDGPSYLEELKGRGYRIIDNWEGWLYGPKWSQQYPSFEFKGFKLEK